MMRSLVTLATIDAAAIAALRVSPSTTARCAGASGPKPKTVDEAGFRAGREIGENVTQPPEVRAVEPVAVDVTRRDHTNRHLRRRLEDGQEKRFAHLGIDLLGIVQQGERPRAPSVERVVVEQDAGDDERPRERSSARLVRTGDEADAEPSVIAEKPLAGLGAHRSEDIGRPGACSRRVRVNRSPAVAAMRQNGRMQSAFGRSSFTSQPAFCSVAPYQSHPPERRFAAQMKTSVSRSMNQAEGLSVQRVRPRSYSEAAIDPSTATLAPACRGASAPHPVTRKTTTTSARGPAKRTGPRYRGLDP